jgi:Polyketide synthase dehydratase
MLGVPALHFLCDHVVAGRSIMPGAAMFETLAAAACCLSEGSGRHVCLQGLSIPSPVPLSVAEPPVLECTIDLPTGRLELAMLLLQGQGASSHSNFFEMPILSCLPTALMGHCFSPFKMCGAIFTRT